MSRTNKKLIAGGIAILALFVAAKSHQFVVEKEPVYVPESFGK